jgi:hypothetical protein
VSTDENAKSNSANAEQDQKILKLVRALNEFDGVCATVNSGVVRSRTGPPQAKDWSICLEIPQDETGWFLLEFLAWLINNDFQKAGMEVRFLPYSQPPYLQIPGRNLMFVVEGRCPAEQVAVAIQRARKECYVPPSRLQEFILDSYGPECLESYIKQNQADEKRRNRKRSRAQPAADLTQFKLNIQDIPEGVIRFRR